MTLRSYLSTLDGAGQLRFAEACGTTRGHMRNVSYGYRQAAPEMAVAAERESGGLVTVESVLPSPHWVRMPDPSWPHPEGRPLLDFAAEPAKAEALPVGGA